MAAGAPRGAAAAEIKVLTAGAFKQVLLALVPEFEKQTGHKVIVRERHRRRADQADRRRRGVRRRRADAARPSTTFPARASSSPAAGQNLARVGVGVVVKDGTPKPDISSVDAFKKALLAAKSVAYIDPAAGGSSGIYVAGLLDKLGIAGRGEAEGQADPRRRGRRAHRPRRGRSSASIRSAKSCR